MQTREQQIVGAIAKELAELEKQPANWKELRSAAQSMPSMMVKHGPTQVVLFYMTKGSANEEKKQVPGRILLDLFRSAMRAVNPASPLAKPRDKDPAPLFTEVAVQSPTMRLRDHALSIEIATWIARSIDARYRVEELKKSTAKPGEAKP